MKPLPLVMAFAPLLAFSLLARLLPSGLIGIAAGAALVIVAAQVVTRRPPWPPAVFAALQAVVFGAIAVASVVNHGGDSWLRTWSGAGVSLVIGAALAALAGVRPFTEPFTREVTPQAYWSAPTFHRINRGLSLLWGAAIAGIGVARVAAAYAERSSSRPGVELLLGVVVPVLIVLGTLRYSRTYYLSITRTPIRKPISKPDPRKGV